MFTKPLTRAPRYILIKSFFLAIGLSYLQDLSYNVFKKIENTMRWYCFSKALRFLQLTIEHQDCPVFTVFLTIKTSSQNISITLLQITFKLHKHRGGQRRKRFPWTILEEQFPVPRNRVARKICNGVFSLLWQLPCHFNPDHTKFSPFSNTVVVVIFQIFVNGGVVCGQTWEVLALKNPIEPP